MIHNPSFSMFSPFNLGLMWLQYCVCVKTREYKHLTHTIFTHPDHETTFISNLKKKRRFFCEISINTNVREVNCRPPCVTVSPLFISVSARLVKSVLLFPFECRMRRWGRKRYSWKRRWYELWAVACTSWRLLTSYFGSRSFSPISVYYFHFLKVV